MEFMPTDWFSMLLLSFVLGMKHGFDADHLATIDGLTRYNLLARPRLARFCGTLFSLGHGSVVILVALGVSTLAEQWQAPEWFGLVGTLISIVFLATLGCLNLFAVLRAKPHEMVRLVGLKGRLRGSLRHVSKPVPIALIGALFAISFDTMSQAVFFALTAAQFGGWQQALLFALLFMLGMMTTDGINGLWIARLIARADQVARVASRVMGLAVAGISLLVSGFGLVKLLSPTVDAWSSGKELLFGASLLALVAGCFLLALGLSRGSRIAVDSRHYSGR